MKKEKLLMTPGPTMLPSEVLENLSRQIIHHRTKEFGAIFTSVNEKLKQVFQTQNPVISMSSSGTGGMESAVINCFSPGDKVIVINVGVFGDRFKKIAVQYGLDVEAIDVPWGQGVDPELVADKLKMDTKGVFVTHNETSTGIMNDLQAISAIVRKTDALLVVDAVSSLGGVDLKTDEWGLDVVITGSQKALMIPPGLAFVSLSPKALDAMEHSSFPKFYFDYKAYLKALEKNDTPFTPAISLIIGLNTALNMILEEGLSNIFSRHKKLANAARNGVHALGLELFAQRKYASDLITSVKAPEGVDVEQVRKIMNQKYDIMVTGGQQHLKGQILRIGHMGFVDGFDLIRTFVALEYALKESNYRFNLGEGVKAVETSLNE